MKHFSLDPSEGPHAAGDLPDDLLEYLHRITSLELAIRTSAEDYEQRLLNLVDARDDMDPMLELLRHERDLMRFAVEVSADLDQLLLTTDPDRDQNSAVAQGF